MLKCLDGLFQFRGHSQLNSQLFSYRLKFIWSSELPINGFQVSLQFLWNRELFLQCL